MQTSLHPYTTAARYLDSSGFSPEELERLRYTTAMDSAGYVWDKKGREPMKVPAAPVIDPEELKKLIESAYGMPDDDKVDLTGIFNTLRDMVKNMPDGSLKKSQKKILAEDALNALATLLSESQSDEDE